MHQIKEWLKLMFSYPTLRMENVDYDSYWKDKRGKGIGDLSDWQRERAEVVLSRLKRKPPASICDIACGDGSILHYISGRVKTDKLIGTDISEFALAKAREFGIETVNLDIALKSELPKIPKADYLLLLEILEHVPHSEELLAAAYDKAGKGVFFSFPNTGFFAHRLRLFFGRFPMQWRLSPGEHVRYWTKRDLIWWLKSLGYKDFSIHYYKGVPVLNKLIPSWFAAAFVVFIPKGYDK
jgi:2-polyprenyl-3-methyl-5-hydroxy-6-metoxy-1,4-benzoquinol methylase